MALTTVAVIGAIIDRDSKSITKAEIAASGHRDLSLENVHEGYRLSFVVVMQKEQGPFHFAIIQPDNTTLFEKEFEYREFNGTDAKISGPHILRVSNPSSTDVFGYMSFRIQPSSWMPIELMFLLFITVISLPPLISGLAYRRNKMQGKKIRGLSAIFIVLLVLTIYQWAGVAWEYWFIEEIPHSVLANDVYDYISWSMATYVLIVLLRQKKAGSEPIGI